jgi:glutamate racemase
VSDPRPIGVFDSGVGGLTVLSEIRDRLPYEHIVYFGDTARVPYGVRDLTEVRWFAFEIIRYLIGLDVKLIVSPATPRRRRLSRRPSVRSTFP